MEAARVAAVRGHSVTLWERRPRLGGQLNRASVAPYKDRINDLVVYYQRQLKKLGVTVELDKEATITEIEQFDPESLVLATGADPIPLSFPGIEGARVVQATDVLDGAEAVDGRVVVIGGGLVGCEVAEYIAETYPGVVTIDVVEMLAEAATAVGPSLKAFLLDSLKGKGIQILTQTTCERLDSEGLVVRCDGQPRTLQADTIVLAAGMVPRRELAESAAGRVPEIRVVGDCVEPRKIREAIAEGCRAGIEL
jgi:NADPH-dependent 2,4-dienoyl-CoA reductase/sulfur reductase-like enzyme